MKVFAFDRDQTVDVNPHPRKEAVPLAWVRYLAHETDHEVWAIGNQKLKREAGIPGIKEAFLHERNWATLSERQDRNKRLLYRLSRLLSLQKWPKRRARVELLSVIFPDAEEYIVVGDVDLSDVTEWTHYHSWDFVRGIENSTLIVGLPKEIVFDEPHA